MTTAARTVCFFGVYLLAEGIFLMIAPAWILSAIGIPDAESPWRTILGFVVAVLGYYYVRNARENLSPFFLFTVQIRIIQFLFFIGFYFFHDGTLALVGFSFIEFVAGLWTWRELRRKQKSHP